MTAQHAEREAPKRGFIPKSLDAVSTSITRHAIDPARVAEFERDYAAAWAAVSEDGDGNVHDISPLLDLVEKWWPTAASWDFDPEGMRRVQARAERRTREGPTAAERAWADERPEGMTREAAIAMWEQANGRPMVRP